MIFEEVKIFTPDAFTDYRGDIWTTYKKGDFPDIDFKHDKYSISRKNVIRGVHGDFKTTKLVSCLHGEMYFVVVDNRKESENYLKWDWTILSEYNKKQVLLPPGFGNGFCVLSDKCLFSYKLSYDGDYSDVGQQYTLKWNDPKIKIDWPINNPILQRRDK